MSDEIERLREENKKLRGTLNIAAHKAVEAKNIINQQHQLVMGMVAISVVMFKATGQDFVMVPKALIEEVNTKVSKSAYKFDVEDEVEAGGLVYRLIESGVPVDSLFEEKSRE